MPFLAPHRFCLATRCAGFLSEPVAPQYSFSHFATPNGCDYKMKRDKSCHPTMLYVQVLRGLYNCVHEDAEKNYLAFYSSQLGGITLDPALMVVPMDDHLVHRGHAVFDTATMTQVLGQTGLSPSEGLCCKLPCTMLWCSGFSDDVPLSLTLLEGNLLKLPLKGGSLFQPMSSLCRATCTSLMTIWTASMSQRTKQPSFRPSHALSCGASSWRRQLPARNSMVGLECVYTHLSVRSRSGCGWQFLVHVCDPVCTACSLHAASSLLCRVNSVLARGWSGWLWHLPVGVLAAQLLLYGLPEHGCPRPFQGSLLAHSSMQ